MNRWLFIDMNSYFAAVEQQDDPALRGRPIAVVPVMSNGSCVIAASIDAKRFGIRTGTRVREAKERCPGLTLVQARPNRYVAAHHSILAAVDRVAPVDRVYSIDEMAIRLVGKEREPASAIDIAQRIKREIRRDVGECLTSSAGVAATRLLAKIACELKKPDGLTLLPLDELPKRLEHLEPEDLPGISGGILARLHAHRITTIRQLWDMPRADARAVWGGVQGEHWWCGFHGIDAPEPATHRHSMGHAHVLPPEHRSDAGAHGIMTRLLHKAAYRLRHHRYWANRLGVDVSHGHAGHWSSQIELPSCQDTRTILEHFERLWATRPTDAWLPRKVSVVLMDLTPARSTTGHLFEQEASREKLGHAMDTVNQRFGRDTVYFAGMHTFRHPMDEKIAFGRIPDEPSLRGAGRNPK